MKHDYPYRIEVATSGLGREAILRAFYKDKDRCRAEYAKLEKELAANASGRAGATTGVVVIDHDLGSMCLRINSLDFALKIDFGELDRVTSEAKREDWRIHCSIAQEHGITAL